MKHRNRNQGGGGRAQSYDRSNSGEDFDVQRDEDLNSGQQAEQGSQQEGENEGQSEQDQNGLIGQGGLNQVFSKLKDTDSKTLVKYAAVGLLVFTAMRRSSLVGAALTAIAVGVATNYLLKSNGAGMESGEGEQQGQEEQSAEGEQQQDMQMGQA